MLTIRVECQAFHRMQLVAVRKTRELKQNAGLICHGIYHQCVALVPANGMTHCTIRYPLRMLRQVHIHLSLHIHPFMMNRHQVFFLSYLRRVAGTPEPRKTDIQRVMNTGITAAAAYSSASKAKPAPSSS